MRGTRVAGTLVALTLAACATRPAAGPTPSASAPSTGTSRPASAPASPVPEIWRFTAARVGGGTIDGADLAGDKAAVWLWAPW
jgi:hypothetical protein